MATSPSKTLPAYSLLNSIQAKLSSLYFMQQSNNHISQLAFGNLLLSLIIQRINSLNQRIGRLKFAYLLPKFRFRSGNSVNTYYRKSVNIIVQMNCFSSCSVAICSYQPLHTTELKDDAGIRLLVLMIICISLAALYARLQVVVDVWAALRCHRCAVTLDVMPVCRLSSPGVRLVRCCSVLILMWCTTWT